MSRSLKLKGVVKISDAEYPQLLKSIGSAPKELHYKGKWDKSIFDNCLAVVGSRRMTSYGRQVIEKLVSEISSRGITIVSGFMYGVDAYAHKTAIEAGGRTIAVMPCGVDIIHPRHQGALYKEILNKGGLIISELKDTFPPALWTYPKRNRIIAGLSQATLVVEAGAKSGSLITAEFAGKFKRRVFAVPGPITSSVSQGTLQLLRQGAAIAVSADDILKEYGLKPKEFSGGSCCGLSLSKLEKIILEKLKEEPMAIDPLSRIVKLSTSELGAVLSLMQLRGIVKEEEGRYYAG